MEGCNDQRIYEILFIDEKLIRNWVDKQFMLLHLYQIMNEQHVDIVKYIVFTLKPKLYMSKYFSIALPPSFIWCVKHNEFHLAKSEKRYIHLKQFIVYQKSNQEM